MTRRNLAAIAALLAPLAGGCESWRNMTTPAPDAVADGPAAARAAPDLVAYLNRQSTLLDSVEYDRVLIDATMGGESVTLNDSRLFCAKPRSLALFGGKAMIPGDLVKAGSNSQEFWIYNRAARSGDTKYIYCSHADFEKGVAQLPFPFDADWALQALGMSTYDPNRNYHVETDQAAREHRLSYEATTPQGETVTRTVVFATEAARGDKPQVRRHEISDAQGQPIATAVVNEVATLSAGPRADGPEAFVQVPTEVVLEWPRQKLKLKLELRSPKVNKPMAPEDARELFTRPQISGVQPVNLATLRTQQFRGATPGTQARARLPRRGLFDR